MAVQAQYPSNILLLNRNVQDSNDYSLQPQPGVGGGGFVEQSSHMLFNNNGGINPRKRSREMASTTPTPTPTTTTTINSFNFSLQNHHHQHQNQQKNHSQNQLIDLSQLQNHQQQQQPNGVSTGLRLSFGDQNHQLQHIQHHHPPNYSSLFEDFALQFKQQSDELSYFLQTQEEQMRRTLADKRQRHYRALIGVAEEAVTRKMREKELEVEKATRRNAELEARAAQLSAEAQAWQAKAQAQEAQAASLQAQLQQAMVGPTNIITNGDNNNNNNNNEESNNKVGEAEDAESAYIDPVSERRVTSPSCKMCRTRVATVVLLPCRHLCVCRDCDEVVQACPLCLSLRSASVEVYLV